MTLDVADLVSLNIRIAEEEYRGNRTYFDDEVLAPAFAMKRAKGTIVNRDAFLSGLRESMKRSTRILSVTLIGENRAAVCCIVTQDGQQYDNFRLFVRDSADSPWKLLAWANEPLPKDKP